MRRLLSTIVLASLVLALSGCLATRREKPFSHSWAEQTRHHQAVQAREPQDDADGAQRQTPGNPHQPLYPYVGAGGERQIGSSSDSPLGFHGSVGWGNKQMPPLPDDAERPK